MNWLFVRAVLALLALPGVVAFAIPVWVIAPEQGVRNPVGLVIVVGGTFILLSCVRDFYGAGRGTLAPWSPPRHVVTVGLYRYSRNPMYVGVIMILIGWAVTFASRAHTVYAAILTIVFYLRVVLFEEPWLARTHGEAWHVYRQHVRRRFIW
jgi:protein-S-isoprenylcysteine O-methyltransferase Ste14